MGLVIELNGYRTLKPKDQNRSPRLELPLVLARLLAAGATEFARVALDAWGREEMDPEELLELCTTYASVAGLENFA